MRFYEIYPIREGYLSNLIIAVQDLLLLSINRGDKEISTEEFRKALASDGYNITINQLIQAVDQSNFASSVDREKIVPKSELPDELAAGGPEDSKDKVSDLAASQAKKDLK